MTDTTFITRPITKWYGFVGTALLYIIINAATVYTTWVTAIDDNVSWSQVSWHDKTTLLALLLGGGCTQIRSLMNSSYQDAKKEVKNEVTTVTTSTSAA